MRNKFLLLINLLWLTQGILAQDAQYVWAKSIGDANYDQGQAIVTDAAGNVFSTGYFMGTADFDPGDIVSNLTSSGYQDVFVSKLDASGNFVWAKKMGGTNYDLGQSIALDAAGNIYTTGYFRGTADYDPGPLVFNLFSNGSNDVFISKLDASGNFVWAKSVGGLTADEGYSIFPDAYGNVYITGSFNGTVDFDPGAGNFTLSSTGAQDIFVLKLDASGNFIWAKKMGGTGADLPTFLKIDAAGDIYTTGYFNATCDFDPGPLVFNLTSGGLVDIYISKLDTAGNFIWAKGFGSSTEDAGYSLGFEATGNVVATGFFSGTVDFDPGAGVSELVSSGSFDIFILKLDAAGNFSWAKKLGGTSSDKGFSLTLDNVGNIYTTGWFSLTADFDPGNATFNLTSGNSTDIFISKLNATGDFVWAKSMMGGLNSIDDVGYAITLDPSKNVLTTGKFTGTVDFNPGATANNLVSKGLTDIFISKLLQIEPLVANFVASATTVLAGESIQFTDLSTGSPTSWQWDFNNDGTVDSNEQNPVWTYNETGTYSVSLTVVTPSASNSLTKPDYIQVNPNIHSVTNVIATQRTDGSKILDVTYNLNGEQQEYFVSLQVSFDNGQNYQSVSHVSGNTGIVSPGQNLHIIWNAGTEFPDGFYHETMKVKVVADEQVLECGGIITDARDGKQYQTVQIGTQCWMAQNINIGTRIDGLTNQNQNGTIEKYCYGNDEANCTTHGGLYQWDEMMDYSTTPGTQGICPVGWHVPTDPEMSLLSGFVGSQPANLCNNNANYIGKSLASVSGWNVSSTTCAVGNNASLNNATGYSGISGGKRDFNATFASFGNMGYFWCSNFKGTTNGYGRGLSYDHPAFLAFSDSKNLGFSVRCVKDEAPANQAPDLPSNPNPLNGSTNQVLDIDASWTCTDPEGDPLTFDIYFGNMAPPPQVATSQISTTYIPGTLAGNTQYFWKIVAHDNHGNTTEGPVWNFTTMAEPQQCGSQITDPRDGKTYSTVQIGTQCWMAQNLNVGTSIDGFLNQTQNGTLEKYCYNDLSTNCDTYGGLYQWDEMMNYSTTPGSQGICMNGWHIPNSEEWVVLIDYFGGESIAGGKMKEAGELHWLAPNTGATNSSGFTGLGGGYRFDNEVFFDLNAFGMWWSSTELYSSYGGFRQLLFIDETASGGGLSKSCGFSVRCVKNQ